MPDVPTIPTPTADVAGLLATTIALKQSVDMLTGQIGDLTSRAAATGSPVPIGATGYLPPQARSAIDHASSAEAYLRSEGDRLQAEATAALTATVAVVQTDVATALAEADNILNVQLPAVNAAIGDEAATRESEDESLTASIDFQASRIDGNASAITSEAVTRDTADTALGLRIDTVEAVSTRQRVFLQSDTPTAEAIGDLWIDTGNGFVIKYWDGDDWVNAQDHDIAASIAAISAETSARTDADGAITDSLTTQISRIDGNESAISSEGITRSNADTALSGRIDTTDANVGANTAAISDETDARVAADGSLASDVSTLRTNFGGNSSTVLVRFMSVSSSDGAAAEFAVEVSADGATFANAGMYMQVFSDGTSRIKFQADEFVIFDSSNHIPFAITSGNLYVEGLVTSTFYTGGVGVNMLFNATLEASSEGWVEGFNNTGLTTTFGRDLPDALPYHPIGGHSIYRTANGTPASGAWFEVYNNNRGTFYPAQAGITYEASAYLGIYRCQAQVVLAFVDNTGNLVGAYDSTVYTSNFARTDLADWSRGSCIGVAPAGTYAMYIIARGISTAEASPYIMVTMPYLGQANTNQTEPSNWTPGNEPQFGGARQLTSGNITTYMANATIGDLQVSSLSANKISAASLSAITANIGTVTAGRLQGFKMYLDLTAGQMLMTD